MKPKGLYLNVDAIQIVWFVREFIDGNNVNKCDLKPKKKNSLKEPNLEARSTC